MKANPENFQLITLGNTGFHTLQISDMTTKSILSVTLLGITIDSKLNFEEHINNFIKKHTKLDSHIQDTFWLLKVL